MRMKADELEKETGKTYALIAESDLNDVKLISEYSKGGYGLQAQWTDDFHHSVHTLLTGETDGYYSDFGSPLHLEKSFKQGMVYDGNYSEFRKKRVGTDPSDQPKHQFVVCIQNHDQVGNRMMGDRLSQVISFEALKLAAGVYLSAPFVPMLFMGEEWGEDRPFQYFVSHGDADLVKAVQEGRSREFEAFQWKGEVPDPQSEATFNNSKVNWGFDKDDKKSTLYKFYKQLIALRKEGAFAAFKGKEIRSENRESKKVLVFSAAENKRETLAVFNFGTEEQSFGLPGKGKVWKKTIASSDVQWGGPQDIPESLQSGEDLRLPASSLIIFTEK
jgi:maltooligosyltrehalose trehalohydrolase